MTVGVVVFGHGGGSRFVLGSAQAVALTVAQAPETAAARARVAAAAARISSPTLGTAISGMVVVGHGGGSRFVFGGASSAAAQAAAAEAPAIRGAAAYPVPTAHSGTSIQCTKIAEKHTC